MRRLPVVCLTLSLTLLPSAASPQSAPPAAAPAPAPATAESTAMALWAQRADLSRFKPTVQAMDAWVAAAPGEWRPLVMTMRTYIWYVYNNHQGGSEDARVAMMAKAVEAGRKAWQLAPGNIEVDFWLANVVGIYGKLYGVTKSVSSYGEIRERLDRVAARDPNFFHGGVWRYYGRLIDQVPSALRLTFGYDLEDAVAYYERALKIEPRYLQTWVYLAECHAQQDDMPAVKRALKSLLAGDTAALKDYKPENELYKREGRALWNKYFPGEAP